MMTEFYILILHSQNDVINTVEKTAVLPYHISRIVHAKTYSKWRAVGKIKSALCKVMS